MEIKVRGRVPPSPPRLVITINDLRNMVSPLRLHFWALLLLLFLLFVFLSLEREISSCVMNDKYWY